jgi:hypothetical protein
VGLIGIACKSKLQAGQGAIIKNVVMMKVLIDVTLL